jgi:hypothetical protein
MDDPALVAGLVDGVRVNTVAYLETNRSRLIGFPRLLGRFDEAWHAWSEKLVPDARQITETVNELLIAKRFLQDRLCASVEYEPSLDGSKKTIDFLFRTTDGDRIFYDAKTIHPTDKDTLRRYERAKREGWFAPGTHLILDEAGQGGLLAHHQFATREKFRDHTLELEEKIRHVSNQQDGHTYFRMVFCGDGFRWHRDHLEDFADVYFTGQSRWDHFAAMEAHYLTEKGLTLERTILGFCYFERGPRLPEPTDFRCDVRGPEFRREQ